MTADNIAFMVAGLGLGAGTIMVASDIIHKNKTGWPFALLALAVGVWQLFEGLHL